MLPREMIRRLPKAELHVHFDGSLRPQTLIDLAQNSGTTLPTTDVDALARYMLVDDAANLEDYIARFDVTIAVLQSPEAIERVAYEMVEDAAADGVRYLEIRYCPYLSTTGGLTMDEGWTPSGAACSAAQRTSAPPRASSTARCGTTRPISVKRSPA